VESEQEEDEMEGKGNNKTVFVLHCNLFTDFHPVSVSPWPRNIPFHLELFTY
jgi:hypothetical protein